MMLLFFGCFALLAAVCWRVLEAVDRWKTAVERRELKR